MNKHIDEISPFEDANHEREWVAQENALRREPLNLDLALAHNNVRDRHYRLLTRALLEPLQNDLPADFATRVAIRANARLASSVRFEFVIIITLVTAMLIATIGVIMIYGSEWLSSFNAMLSSLKAPTSSWLMTLVSCLVVSWLVEQWQRYKYR